MDVERDVFVIHVDDDAHILISAFWTFRSSLHLFPNIGNSIIRQARPTAEHAYMSAVSTARADDRPVALPDCNDASKASSVRLRRRDLA
jgi:hypothetical protein